MLALFQELGAEVIERERSRVGIVLFGEIRVMHRPHPTPNLDKAAALAAQACGQSLNQWVGMLIDQAIHA